MQRVYGGDIWVVDTEAKRSLYYADDFRFQHVPFDPPFSPSDYIDVYNYIASKGAKIIVTDSMSHEHEGDGGLMDMFEAELDRVAGNDIAKRERCKGMAWMKPKAEHKRLRRTIVQTGASFIFCYRSQEKLEWGGKPKELGFQPVGDKKWLWDMNASFVLTPGCNGVPKWDFELQSEGVHAKRPKEFADVLTKGRQLDEGVGFAMAEFAAGVKTDAAELVSAYGACGEPPTLAELERKRRAGWMRYTKDEKMAVKTAADAATARVLGGSNG